MDNLLEGCQVIDPEYRYLYVNDAVVRHGRSTREELLGRTMMECYPGIETTEMFAMLRRCMEDRAAAKMENEFAFPDGSTAWFELRFEPVPEGVTILSVDVTDKKRAEEALHRTMRALATLSRCNRTLVRATQEDQFVDDVCRVVVEAGAYEAVFVELPGPDGRRRIVASASQVGGDVSDGPTLALDLRVRGDAIGTLTFRAREAVAFDPSERDLLEEVALDVGYGIETLRARATHQRTEAELVAARRLEAVGRLAGGIAHDFNNLLSVILTYGTFASEQLHDADPVRRDVEQVVAAADRAAELTHQLLAFSCKQVLEPRVTNLVEIVRGVEVMLRRLLGETIEIEVDAPPGVGNVRADPGQLEQVVMNLAVNARDAMPDGGKLTIAARNLELPAGLVELSVADTGAGMSPETCSRIFEPFFTTKELGKGTGLGLSTVHGITEQSGGSIRVDSEPGVGTTFRIRLPRVDAPADARDDARPTVLARGSETILLAEDDLAVRNAVARILRSAGYRVLPAANGQDALALGDQHRGEIDLLLTDVVMPRMDGRDLARGLAVNHPNLEVLYTTGYAEQKLDPGMQYIAKPFSATTLAEKVRRILDGD